jgi:hypothetical protein
VDNSSGAGNGLFAGTNGTNSPRRALIDFDISGNIPLGATINSVSLTLYLGQIAGSGGGGPGGTLTSTIDLHKLTADWGEGNSQQQIPPSDSFAGQGQGAPANPNDATWNARFYPGKLWMNPGGDFVPAISATATTGTLLNAPTVWGSTEAMVSDAQSWLDNPSSNFGWILVNEDETDTRTFRAYYSRETATETWHPQLQVTYTLLGDVNRDGLLGVADISALTSALANLDAYQSTHGPGGGLMTDGLFLEIADLDHDGVVTNKDIQSLIVLLANSESGAGLLTTVPEPGAFAMMALAGVAVLSLRLAEPKLKKDGKAPARS